MFGARLRRQHKTGAKESRAQLGNQLFPRITFIAPTLAPEFTVEALRMLCPVAVMPISA